MGGAEEFVREPGVVFASAAARALLEQDGLLDLEAVLACGEALPATNHGRHRERDVRRATLRDGDTVYIKRQLRPGRLWPRMTEVLHGVAFQPFLRTEWDSIWRLRRAGLHAMEPLALFAGRRWRARRALIVRAVPPEKSLERLIWDRFVVRLPAADRRSLATEVARVLRTVHGAGLTWRGVEAKHLYPERLADGAWRMWLIDCCGAYENATARDRKRDRWKLLHNLAREGADEEFLRMVTELTAEAT